MSFVKDPDATLDYQVDWSAWVETGETITASIWLVPDGITKVSDSHTTTTATIWLSGGTDWSDYRVTNRVTTNAGRIDDRTILIKVRQR